MTIALLLVLVLVPATGASPPPVTYVDGRVSARLEDADLREVLDEVARQAGLQVRGALREARTRSLDLEGVPLPDALARLLEGESFLLTYGDTGLRGVRLLGAPGIAFQAPSAAPADLPPVEPSGAQLASERPVPIGGRLARAVGAGQASFSDVIDVAMRHPDPRVRVDALRIGFRVLDAEPELQESVLYTLDHWGDEQLAGWLSQVAGPYAEDLARRTARNARWVPLRRRAASVTRVFEAGLAAGG